MDVTQHLKQNKRMKSSKFLIEETVTLDVLYGDNLPDRDERFWNYVT